MFSDRHRPLKLLAAAAAVVALGAWYAHLALRVPGGWWEATADPVGHDGAPQLLPLYTVEAVSPGRLVMGKVARGIPVDTTAISTDLSGVAPGTTVSVAGHFRAADGAIVADVVEIHRLRPWKKALGVLGLLGALGVAPLSFRWRAGRLEQRG